MPHKIKKREPRARPGKKPQYPPKTIVRDHRGQRYVVSNEGELLRLTDEQVSRLKLPPIKP
jgi:hypothetical protein